MWSAAVACEESRILRILRVSGYYEPAFGFGGPARSISTICKAIAATGVQQTVFTTNAAPDGVLDVPTDGPVDVGGVDVHYFPLKHRTGFYSPALARACADRVAEFDIVEISSVWMYPGIPASRACVRRGVPYVVSLHNSLVPQAFSRGGWRKRVYWKLFQRPIFRRAAGIIYSTQLEMEKSAWVGLDSQPAIIPNAADTSQFETMPARGQLRSRLGIPPEARVLLFMGRLHPDKGLDITLPAFGRMLEQHADAHFIVGGPDERGYLETLRGWVADLNIEARVHFTGLLTGEDRLSAFADADLLVLASRYENFGMAAVEGMAAGLPVVISDQVESWPEIAPSEAAFIVPMDETALTTTLVDGFRDMATLRTMGERGRDFVARRFNTKAVAEQHVELYREVINEARGSE